MKILSRFALIVVAGLALTSLAQSQRASAAEDAAKTYTFTDKAALENWAITGDVTIDPAKSHGDKTGSLKLAPGAKAVLKLRDTDGSGKVDMWVYDDLTKPEKPKENRVGPRWAIAQKDGKLLAISILYASYLGGDEGYTAVPFADKGWYNELFWLGVNRAPAGWHHWTFDFDPEKGLHVSHNGNQVDDAHFDTAKVGMNGFNSIVLFGDSEGPNPQTLWVSDITVTLGGPVKNVPVVKEAPKPVKGPNPWVPTDQKVTVYTKDNAPAAPKLDDMPLKDSVSEYGITWTFDKPAHVGQFINGDWYVVGPVTVKAIDPKPLYGADVPEDQLDHMDKEHPEAQHLRNGFMLNPPNIAKMAYDSGVRNFWDPSLIQHLPVDMKPGDSLVSTISMPANLTIPTEMGRNSCTRGEAESSPTRTSAILTCVSEPLAADAFRPAFSDRHPKIYYAHDLRRDLLPKLAKPKSMPDIALWTRYVQRPWVDMGFFGFGIPVENTPWYALETGRVSGGCALLLCTDATPEEKEPLLVDYVQVGIDLGGMLRGGFPGWEAFGGHGSGRKIPIVFAGILLGDDELANVNKSFPKAHFGEDEQTAYGDSWTGAKVVFCGHRGIDQVTDEGRPGTGPYEHKPPKEWTGGDHTSEGYRRCCTSVGWVAQALALRLMHAEKYWDHPAFFDYIDRWMYEDDSNAVKVIKADAGLDYTKSDWAQEGQSWENWVNEMWAQDRKGPGLPPTDGWQQPHDETWYKHAMENIQK